MYGDIFLKIWDLYLLQTPRYMTFSGRVSDIKKFKLVIETFRPKISFLSADPEDAMLGPLRQRFRAFYISNCGQSTDHPLRTLGHRQSVTYLKVGYRITSKSTKITCTYDFLQNLLNFQSYLAVVGRDFNYGLSFDLYY